MCTTDTRHATEQMKSTSQRPLAFSKILGSSPVNFLKSSIFLDLNFESNISLGTEGAIIFKQQIKGKHRDHITRRKDVYFPCLQST